MAAKRKTTLEDYS